MDNLEELPKVGARILVHNPDFVSRDRGKVKIQDVGKVLGYAGGGRVLAFNPEWENKTRPISEGYSLDYTYRGLCIVLLPYEYEVIL